MTGTRITPVVGLPFQRLLAWLVVLTLLLVAPAGCSRKPPDCTRCVKAEKLVADYCQRLPGNYEYALTLLDNESYYQLRLLWVSSSPVGNMHDVFELCVHALAPNEDEGNKRSLEYLQTVRGPVRDALTKAMGPHVDVNAPLSEAARAEVRKKIVKALAMAQQIAGVSPKESPKTGSKARGQ